MLHAACPWHHMCSPLPVHACTQMYRVPVVLPGSTSGAASSTAAGASGSAYVAGRPLESGAHLLLYVGGACRGVGRRDPAGRPARRREQQACV